jgi:polyisoprenoid-binding protein YceI
MPSWRIFAEPLRRSSRALGNHPRPCQFVGALMMKAFVCAALCSAISVSTMAAPVTYEIEPGHTYPSFEADHMGVSLWRGKFNSSSGTVVLDREAQTGMVDIKIDMASVDFGHDKMNEHARAPDIFDVAKFPTATYQGKFANFVNGEPREVDGQLTMKGVTQPVKLKLNWLRCKEHPMMKKPFCGADAIASFKRDAFGVDYGRAYGFNMDVTLRIAVEAIAK